MPWQNQGGGGGGPWGGGGGGGSPWGRGPQPPNIEEFLRKSQDRVRRLIPGGMGQGRGVLLVVAALVLLWLASGFYRVQPDEIGVVRRFGAFNRTATSGLNYHLPIPIEEADTPKVTRVNRVEVGFRGEGRSGEIASEALMLTGDENIIDINFTVFWTIKDPKAFLFNIRGPELNVKVTAESAMREVIGHSEFARAVAEGRAQIEADTLKLLQEILDTYGSGILITQLQLQKSDPPGDVILAFQDVQSAKINQQQLINEAQAYSNDVVPKSHGDAARIIQAAQAYRQQIVQQAQGDAARFLSVYQAYKVAADVTARRLYIETMESILRGTTKVLIDKAASTTGALPYLPLPAIQGPPPAAPQSGARP